MTQTVLERIVAQNLNVYRVAPGRLREDVSTEAQVASDYRGRLVYELLQNADDAMESAGSRSDSVALLVTDDALWVANNGRPLSELDVESLCGLGASTKVDASGIRRASIGHKGLGFKSALEITDSPAAHSTTFSFELGQHHAEPVVRALFAELGFKVPNAVPAMRFPQAITPSDQWLAFESAGHNTGFQFPFKSEVTTEHRRQIASRLLDLPLTTVMFLKHLDRVEIRVEQSDRSEARAWTIHRDIRSGEGQWEATDGMTASGLYRVAVRSDHDESAHFIVAHDADLPIGDNRTGLVGPAWEGVSLTEISVAALDPTHGVTDMPDVWRRFHVFLPTGEHNDYPLVVNGAFATDLSRQHVKVTDDPRDYNSHLIDESARLFEQSLLPALLDHGVASALAVLERHQRDESPDSAAGRFHAALVTVLADRPILPAGDSASLAFTEAVLPPSSLGNGGVEFRELLATDASWRGRRFPEAPYCAGKWTRVAADHGALQLSPAESLPVLADQCDPVRTSMQDDESGGFELDPVLEMCVALWQLADSDQRTEMEGIARKHAVFPVDRSDDRIVTRVALGNDAAFYPPRSARHQLPLEGLAFMCHSICWGALTPRERGQLLENRMKAWTALFDVKEFRFAEVMRAVVTPALVLNPEEDAKQLRSRLESMDALGAICQIAGTFTKPEKPLRYERLGSDRALFNLSRLPVPVRVESGPPRWTPAFRVYFGSDWIGDDSVERILDALPDSVRQELDIPLLAPVEDFLGLLADLSEDIETDEEAADEEVGLDEDTDRIMETDELSRWMAFLGWIGVNKALRPIHFHDVEDADTGWLRTRDLEQPGGWAFEHLGSTWTRYRESLVAGIRTTGREVDVVPYLYEVHDLEGIVHILRIASRDTSNETSTALAAHLARHWSFYETFARATVALVASGKSPGQRSKPPRALTEEITEVADNLWLWRLRQAAFCPTSHGPRLPHQTWLPSDETERRFGRSGRSPGDFLPLLELSSDGSKPRLTRFASTLGIQTEMSPSTFGVENARVLCNRLGYLYAERDIDSSALRRVIRPIYREMFELLSGQSPTDHPERLAPLATAPLLAETAAGYQFLPANRVFYSQVPGFRERSGLGGRLPTFVIEAEPRANAPLSALFQIRSLEESIEWQPRPGESPLDADEIERFRQGLSAVIPDLLTRIRAERSDQRDTVTMRTFADHIEPVEALEVDCRLDGELFESLNDREYYVSNSGADPFHAYVTWSGDPWPPNARDAQVLAMALADVLGINLVEAFIAFLQADAAQRGRLIRIAGASARADEVDDELSGQTTTDEPVSDSDAAKLSVDENALTEGDEEPASYHDLEPDGVPPGVPLVRYSDLVIDGEPIIVHGQAEVSNMHGSSGAAMASSHIATQRAAAGTDLVALNELGMKIATTYEVRRLRADGRAPVALDGVREHPTSASDLVVDVSTPVAIASARLLSPVFDQVLGGLEELGLDPAWPGCDLVTVRDRQLDRLIELKSSGVDARVQAMTWNEWKSARSSDLRSQFWLYLVGNLRADLGHALPYVRAIQDPFGTLLSEVKADLKIHRAVQLRVREFEEAEQLTLEVRGQ